MDRTCGYTDHTIKGNAVFHKHIQNSCCINTSHAAAFKHQPCLFFSHASFFRLWNRLLFLLCLFFCRIFSHFTWLFHQVFFLVFYRLFCSLFRDKIILSYNICIIFLCCLLFLMKSCSTFAQKASPFLTSALQQGHFSVLSSCFNFSSSSAMCSIAFSISGKNILYSSSDSSLWFLKYTAPIAAYSSLIFCFSPRISAFNWKISAYLSAFFAAFFPVNLQDFYWSDLKAIWIILLMFDALTSVLYISCTYPHIIGFFLIKMSTSRPCLWTHCCYGKMILK